MKIPIKSTEDGGGPARDCVRLVLQTAEGDIWPLTVSRGIEPFIGRYVRVAELRCAGPLLRFVAVTKRPPPPLPDEPRASGGRQAQPPRRIA